MKKDDREYLVLENCSRKYSAVLIPAPGAPLAYFNDGGGPKDFFGSDISAKRDFFGSIRDAGIFLGRENNRGIFWGIVFFISSNQK